MDDICLYEVQIRGQVDENDLNSMSPTTMTIERAEPASTYIHVRTDQAGMIGLIRHLHGLGFFLLSITCHPNS